MDKALEADPKENYYDAACLYSLMDEKERSISYLRKALENGFRRLFHIKRDRYLENIRSSEEYESLMKEYEEKLKAEMAEDKDESVYEQKSEEVPFTKV